MIAPVLSLLSDPLDGFAVPEHLKAGGPPESRGLDRDEVRLMATSPGGTLHLEFRDLPSVLESGDLLVVNNSRTRPAAVRVSRDLAIHFSTSQPGGHLVVEPRIPSGMGSERHLAFEESRVQLPGDASLDVLGRYPAGSPSRRLWLATFAGSREGSLDQYLGQWGQPIRYSHVDAPYPISSYQTIFGTVAGSAEMPSAGRPFSSGVVTSLVNAGVRFASLTLHTGVSSLESGELPYPEWFEIPESTATLINHTHRRGGRVIAVGTTVVRALESAADSEGTVHPVKSITDLVIHRDHHTRAVDGLITGWHEPESTHLEMLEAVAGRPMVSASYSAALERGCLWHEFGDSLILLPDRMR